MREDLSLGSLAATVCLSDCTSIPSRKGTSLDDPGEPVVPARLRHRVSAPWPGRNIMESMVLRLGQPLPARVRWRTVARGDSIGLVGQMPCHCPAGNSKEGGHPILAIPIRCSAASGYMASQEAGKWSTASSASSRVSAIRTCCRAVFTPGWPAFGTVASTLAVLHTRQRW